MPKRGGRGGAAKGARYERSNLSPPRASKSPAKKRAGGDHDDSKDLAVILAQERTAAKRAMREFADNTLEGIAMGSIDVDHMVREGIETLCRECLQWLDTPVGDKALTDEYQLKLGEMRGSLDRALELTKVKRQEPPLPLNIYEHDHLIITDENRQLESAVKNGDTSELKRLLSTKRGRALINNKDENGWASLHHAVSAGDAAIVAMLLREEADVNQDNNDGWTPVHLSCARGRTAALPLLINAGAQLDTTTRQPPQWTPLHFAAANGELDAVEALINARADVNAKAAGDWTPLHLASMNGHTEVCVALMWGDKEKMTNLADNSLGLETWTGDGKTVVSGMVPSLTASCHNQVRCFSNLNATMLRVKDELMRRQMEYDKKHRRKQKMGEKGKSGQKPSKEVDKVKGKLAELEKEKTKEMLLAQSPRKED